MTCHIGAKRTPPYLRSVYPWVSFAPLWCCANIYVKRKP